MALDSSQIARMDAIVAKAAASVKEAQAAVDRANSWWSGLIGAGSSMDALRSNAAAAQTLYQVLLDKRDRLALDPYADENDVLIMEGAIPAFSNTAANATADMLTVGAGIQATAPKVGDIPWWVYAAGAVALLAILSPYVNRRK